MSDVVEIVVTGVVQGVGYRMWARDTAASLGLRGVVRNRRDGSVQAIVAGAPERIDAFEAACRAGPPLAEVEAVERRAAEEGALADAEGVTIGRTG